MCVYNAPVRNAQHYVVLFRLRKKAQFLTVRGIIAAYLISLPVERGKMEGLAFRGKHCKQKYSYFNGGTNVSKSRFCVVYCSLIGFPDDWLGISRVGISRVNSPAAAVHGMVNFWQCRRDGRCGFEFLHHWFSKYCYFCR